MNKKIEKILNQQINNEYFSSYLYLSMAAFFDSMNLNGFSNWMKKQAQEELAHTMKIFDFLAQRGARVILSSISSPQIKWNSPLNAFESALAHEKKVTKQIHSIYELSKKEKDHATEILMQWFVSEQVEEEDSAGKIVEKLKMIKDSKSGLLVLDKELSARK